MPLSSQKATALKSGSIQLNFLARIRISSCQDEIVGEFVAKGTKILWQSLALPERELSPGRAFYGSGNWSYTANCSGGLEAETVSPALMAPVLLSTFTISMLLAAVSAAYNWLYTSAEYGWKVMPPLAVPTATGDPFGVSIPLVAMLNASTV